MQRFKHVLTSAKNRKLKILNFKIDMQRNETKAAKRARRNERQNIGMKEDVPDQTKS